MGSILLSLVGGLEPADAGVVTMGLETTMAGDWMTVCGVSGVAVGSMMGMLVPGSPGSLFCSSSLSLSLSGPKLDVN